MKTKRVLSLALSILMIMTVLPLSVAAYSDAVVQDGIKYSCFYDVRSYYVESCMSSTTIANIASYIKGAPVIHIAAEAFKNCDNLKNVTIPSTITSIGLDAFAGCDNLQYNIYGNGKYLGNESNPYYALIDTISIDITDCKIHDQTQIISSRAFEFCESLTSIKIPESVKWIGIEAFDGCSSLKRVQMNNSVTAISEKAFRNCESLEYIKIPDSVTVISNLAFENCRSLTSVAIPDSVVKMGYEVFEGCEFLVDIYCEVESRPSEWCDSISYDWRGDCDARIYWGYDFGNLDEPHYDDEINNESNELTQEQYYDYYVYNGGAVISAVDTSISGDITIPSKLDDYPVKELDYCAFQNCDSITSVVISDSVTRLGGNAFLNCTSLASIEIPDSVIEIGDQAFARCTSITNIKIPNSVTTIGYNAFYECESLTTIEIPNSVTEIDYGAFSHCTSLASIEIPDSVIEIGRGAFSDCVMLVDIYCEAKAQPEKWNADWLGDCEATVHWGNSSSSVEGPTEDNFKENGLVIYSDYSSLRVRKGSVITLAVGIFSDGEQVGDMSGISFQIEDTSILKMSSTDIKDNYRYVKLKGIAEGKTTVVFTDSNTGYTATVPITVYDDNYLSYTLNSVPTQNIEKYPTNIYNVNGLFVDSYEYTVNDDQSATVSFDVYNTNYIYGVVEVFDENGNMKDAVLIEKMTSSNTSIKEALWDNIGYLVRDIVDGDLLSYRQESGYSKKTSVSVKIPKNGYIKITTDPENSLIVGLVNSVDGLMSMASLAGDIKDFDINSKEFSQKLTKKLLADQIYIELIKDGSDASKNLWKNVGKETFITSESMGNYADTITKNIDELKLGSIIADTAADFGWNIGENVFTYFSGPAGTALNIIFTIGKVENIIIQQNDLTQSSGVGSIYIQNQGGGFRACQQIKVESDDSLSSDTALNVFTATLDSTILDIIEDLNPEIYEAISNGITRTYNISLIKSGEETQPNGKVTVYIPISDDFKALAYAGDLTGKIKIYRVEEDGGLTEMDVEIDDGCFVFTTDHFSLYTIVGYDFENTEIKSDEKINIPLIIGVVSAIIVALGAISILIFKRKKKTA